jgi:hypothetical protein
VLLLLSNPAPARAAKIPIFIVWGSGETITYLQDLSADVSQKMPQEMPRHLKVGFLYSYVHVFWGNLWTWNGRYVLYDGTRYWPLQEGEVFLFTGRTEEDFGKPLFYRVPVGLVVLAGLAFLGVGATIQCRAQAARTAKANAALAGLLPDAPRRPFHPCFTQLFQPDDVLRQRVPAATVVGDYLKAIDESLTAFAAEHDFSGQALSLFLAVRPGRRSRAWVEFQPGGVPAVWERDLVPRLEAVPAPEVTGLIALATYSLLWGGPGTKENLFVGVPRAWAEAAGPKGAEVDDLLDRVWPD